LIGIFHNDPHRQRASAGKEDIVELSISTTDESISRMPSDCPPLGKLRPIRGGLGLQYDLYKHKLGKKALSKSALVKKIWNEDASVSNFANINRGDRFITAANAVRFASELACSVESIVHIETKDDQSSLKVALQHYLSNWPLPLREYSTSELADLLGRYVKARDQAMRSGSSETREPIRLDIRRAAVGGSASDNADRGALVIDLLKDVASDVGRLHADGDVEQSELKLGRYKKELRSLGLYLLSGQYVAREVYEGGWNGIDEIWLRKFLVLKVSKQPSEKEHKISRSKEPLDISAVEENHEALASTLEDFLVWSNGKIV
jgi:hypothetical protein